MKTLLSKLNSFVFQQDNRNGIHLIKEKVENKIPPGKNLTIKKFKYLLSLEVFIKRIIKVAGSTILGVRKLFQGAYSCLPNTV